MAAVVAIGARSENGTDKAATARKTSGRHSAAFHATGARVAMGDVRKDAVERAAGGLGAERVFAGLVDVRDKRPL